MERDIEVCGVEDCGRGVFACRGFKRGAIIERCHVYVIVNHHRCFDTEGLSNYELAWGHKKVAFATGMAHLYNHSSRPNVRFERDLMRGVITVRTTKPIKPGDELRHRYACAPWFQVCQ